MKTIKNYRKTIISVAVIIAVVIMMLPVKYTTKSPVTSESTTYQSLELVNRTPHSSRIGKVHEDLILSITHKDGSHELQRVCEFGDNWMTYLITLSYPQGYQITHRNQLAIIENELNTGEMTVVEYLIDKLKFIF